MQPTQPSRIVVLVGALITFTAIVGYFVGLQSPMNPFEKTARVRGLSQAFNASHNHVTMEAGSIQATDYSQMATALQAKSTPSGQTLFDSRLPTVYTLNEQTEMSPGGDAKISLEEKRFALSMRRKNRAFNGAPPTVPHPIAELSAESCVACHSEGTKSATLRIPKMSHPVLTNCTQCHVGVALPDMVNAMVRENHFIGLAAPEGGPKAFAGAPPQIPHATWMRDECLSCHGQASYRGLQTTHPWRQNCQQCHAPSSTLEQTTLESKAMFLDAIKTDSH